MRGHVCARFQTPAIGLIVIGVFTFIGGLIGCVGAIRERQRLLYVYCCVLLIVILLQLVFGAAAAAVAGGNAPEIQGPLQGALEKVSIHLYLCLFFYLYVCLSVLF